MSPQETPFEQSPEFDILDQVPTPVFVLQPDAEGVPRYLHMNTYIRSRLNLTPEQIIGRTASDIYGSQFGDIALEQHKQALNTGTTAEYILTLPLKSQKATIRTCLQPVRDNSGEIHRIVGTSQNVSEKRILSQMGDEISTLNKEVEVYLSLAAHDLRSPILNIQAIADLLLDDFEDLGDGKIELIHMLERVGTKALALITDVLSHAQAVNVREESTVFEFGDLVTDVLAVLDPFGACRLSYTDATVRGDRVATQIALRNLMDNALKYAMNDTAVPLTLDVKIEDPGTGYFKVALSDNGRGFDDPGLVFLQDGKLRTDSGYGLVGLRRLINARGGEIEVRNNACGKGATVTFTLAGTVTSRPQACQIPKAKPARAPVNTAPPTT